MVVAAEALAISVKARKEFGVPPLGGSSLHVAD